MNHDDHDHHDALPADLRARLAALRRDVAPQRDLWPTIAAQLAHAPVDTTTGSAPSAADAAGMSARAAAMGASQHAHAGRGRRRPARLAPYAVAASLVIALAVGWQLVPRAAPDAAPAIATGAAQEDPLLRAADAMTREYMGALRELDAARATDAARAAATSAASAGAFAELDRSADEVRAALEHDPDAVFLFHRLQHIHARRLALARRLA